MAVLKMLKKGRITHVTLLPMPRAGSLPMPPAARNSAKISLSTPPEMLKDRCEQRGEGGEAECNARGEAECDSGSDWFTVTTEHLQELRQHLDAGSLADLALDEAGKIGYTYKCVSAAFLAALKSLTSTRQNTEAIGTTANASSRSPRAASDCCFKSGVMALVVEAGDADTNATVCGALLGCHLGYGQLPRDWLAGLKHFRHLWQKCDRLCALLGLLPEAAGVAAVVHGHTMDRRGTMTSIV